MFRIQRRRKDEFEIRVSVYVILGGLCITVIGNVNPLAGIEVWRSLFTAIGTALLGAACVTIIEQEVLRWRHKKVIQPFEEFWGQEFEGPPGRILLQADTVEALAQHFANARNVLLDTGVLPEDAGTNRTFKARAWINRYDTEGAKDIREQFALRNFAPPLFQAIGRESSEGAGDKGCPFEISMGLGFTRDMVERVNNVCGKYLFISLDEKLGDIIDVHIKHLHEDDAVPPELDFRESPRKDFHRLVPKDWKHENYLNIKDQEGGLNDYGYIVRYRAKENSNGWPIMFHMAGFTEHGTWAVGHYIANNWEEVYKYCVKGESELVDNVTVIMLAGKSPFSPELQNDPKWKWRKVNEITARDGKARSKQFP